MNAIAIALEQMLAAGLPHDQIVSAVARMVDNLPRPETKEERKKRVSRETSERYRTKQRDANASLNVTERHQMSPDLGDANASPVTQSDAKTSPPRARIVDNPLRLVIDSSSASAAERADDWPKGQPGDLARTLASLAGPGLADFHKSPGLCSTAGEIIRWQQAGCSWSLDVLPTIQGRTQRARASPLASWTPLTPDVLAARNRRLSPLPEARNEPANDRKTARDDRLGRMLGGAAQALDGS